MIDNGKGKKSWAKEEIWEIASSLDTIFYFVCPENLQLKEAIERKIADGLAEKLGLTRYALKSGSSVQDPKILHEELSNLRFDQFDIVFISKEYGEISLLSHDQKIEFVADLENYDINTGLIAKRFVDESEATSEIIFKED